MSKKKKKLEDKYKEDLFSYKREGTLSFLEHKPSIYIYIYIFYLLSPTSNWCDFWSLSHT